MTATLTAPPTIQHAPPPRRGASPVAASAAFIGRSLRQSLRDGEGLTMAIVLPIMLMLLFTLVFGGAIQEDGYIDYVVPGIILLCAGFGAASIAVSVSRDMTAGAMSRYRTLPIQSATVLVGHTVASMARNLLATAIVIGVALLLGFRSDASVGEQLIAGVREVVYGRSIPLATQHLSIVQAQTGAQGGVRGAAIMVLHAVLAADAIDAFVAEQAVVAA